VNGDDSAPSPSTEDDGERLDTFDVALDAAILGAMELNSALGKLEYAAGIRARRDVEHALARAQELVAANPGVLGGAEALAQLHRIREIVTPMLARAPSPSADAITEAKRGNFSVWRREEQAWIAMRHAGYPTMSLLRRRHTDTRPDTPTALRDTAASSPALVHDPSPDKEGTR
jgi:hypothetical protein